MTLLRVFTPAGAMRAWATILMLILGFGLALGLTIGYVARERRQDDARWCALFGILVVPQPVSPPQTPQEIRGRAITAAIIALYRELGCS